MIARSRISLAKARREVREAEFDLRRQEALVQALEELGFNSGQARSVLGGYRAHLQESMEHLQDEEEKLSRPGEPGRCDDYG